MSRFVTLLIALVVVATGVLASPLGPDGDAGRRLPGKFVWLDLATHDLTSARAFYGAVFNWKFRDAPGAPASYTLIENDSGKVAGMFRHVANSGTLHARWLALISVPDVAAAAQTVRASGGQVLLPPRTVPGRGTHAVFRDPDGAVFGVLANEGGDPADTPVEEGDVFWLDLFAPDPQTAASFYASLAGYDINVGEIAGRKRTVLSTNGIARAGIARLPAGGQPGWLPYILVADVPATLARVREAGGRVVMAPRSELLDGKVAVIADPQGGMLGIVNWPSP